MGCRDDSRSDQFERGGLVGSPTADIIAAKMCRQFSGWGTQNSQYMGKGAINDMDTELNYPFNNNLVIMLNKLKIKDRIIS